MKLVSEEKLTTLFNLAFDLGRSYEKRTEPMQSKTSIIETLVADCHPEEAFSQEVVKLKDSA